MAYSHMEVHFKGKCIRKFGGNNSDVKSEINAYKSLDYVKEKHPWIKDEELKEVKAF
jgi:hypothetical protein